MGPRGRGGFRVLPNRARSPGKPVICLHRCGRSARYCDSQLKVLLPLSFRALLAFTFAVFIWLLPSADRAVPGLVEMDVDKFVGECWA